MAAAVPDLKQRNRIRRLKGCAYIVDQLAVGAVPDEERASPGEKIFAAFTVRLVLVCIRFGGGHKFVVARPE